MRNAQFGSIWDVRNGAVVGKKLGRVSEFGKG